MFNKKYIKYILNAICVVALFFTVFPTNKAFAVVELEPVPTISSESAVVYSVDSKEKLLSYKSGSRYYPAGVAKLMTAILAVENAERTSDNMPKDSETVTVGKEILTLTAGYTSAGFAVGDVVSLPDLITAAIVGNADDAAIIIGTYIGRKDLGGVADPRYNYDRVALEHFIDMMNHKVSLMGLSQTTFANCTGYDGGTTSHSSAEDIAKISAEFLNYAFLKEVASHYSIEYWEFDEARENVWTSGNELMNPESPYFYEYCKGLAACRTSKNRVYISAYAEYHDIKVIAVIMDGNAETAYEDIIKLFNYVFNNYVMYTYIENGQTVAEYFVKNAMDPSNEHLKVRANGGGKYLSRIDKLDLFGFEIRLDSKFYSPTAENLYEQYISPSGGITKGDRLGTLDIYYNAVYIDTVIIYAGNTVPIYEILPTLNEKKWYHNVDWPSLILIVCVIFLIVCIFVLLVSILNKIKKQRIVRQKYSVRTVQKKPAIHYNKKK